MMAPLLRTTLAPRGRTPRLEQRASHRDRVSVAAALWRAPGPSGLVRLAYRTFPDRFVETSVMPNSLTTCCVAGCAARG